MKRIIIWSIVLTMVGVGTFLLLDEMEKKEDCDYRYRQMLTQYEEEQHLSLDEAIEYVGLIESGSNTEGPGTYKTKARWEQTEDGRWFWYEGSWFTRIDGATIYFKIKNRTNYHRMRVKLRVSGKTKYKNENSFIFESKKFSEVYETDLLNPGETKEYSVFLDTYVTPQATDLGSAIGGFITMFLPDDSPARSRQPIDPSSISFSILDIKTEDTYPDLARYRYSGWLKDIGF